MTVCSVTDLHNKLGASAEFFDGSPRIGPACDGTFLGIECEARVQRKRPPTSSVDEGSVTATAAKSLVDDEDEAAGGVREADVSSDEEDQSGKQVDPFSSHTFLDSVFFHELAALRPKFPLQNDSNLLLGSSNQLEIPNN